MKVTRTGKRRVRLLSDPMFEPHGPHNEGFWFGQDADIIDGQPEHQLFAFSMTRAERRGRRERADFWETDDHESTGPAALRRIAGEMIFNPKVAHKVIALFAGLVEEIEL